MRISNSLPMGTPVITSYPTHANALSCLAPYPESMEWFYNYYVQMLGGKDISSILFLDFCAPLPWKACPWIRSHSVPKELIDQKWSSVPEFLMDSIDRGYYVFLYLDQFYIPGSAAFQRFHLVHDNFVFGYNRQDGLLEIADFFQYTKYSTCKASFAQVEEAYRYGDLQPASDQLQGVILVKPAAYEHFAFNLQVMKDLLEDFLMSANRGKSYTDGYRLDLGDRQDLFAYGLEVYGLLEQRFGMLLSQNQPLDIRSLHVLIDHKTLMLERIRYLEERGLLRSGAPVRQQFRDIGEQLIILRNLAIKDAYSGRMKEGARIVKAIPGIRMKEKLALEALLDQLAPAPLPV